MSPPREMNKSRRVTPTRHRPSAFEKQIDMTDATQPPPMPYQPFSPELATDLSHLRALSICHYVWGGLMLALSSLAIGYIIVGAMIASGRLTFPAPPPSPGATTVATNAAPPALFGAVFITAGSCALLFGWTFGILTILSGRWIAQRRRRTFSLVIAGINCASFPFGTLLGVFTFIVLLRPSVKAMYPA
jgi:hypothetical protein